MEITMEEAAKQSQINSACEFTREKAIGGFSTFKNVLSKANVRIIAIVLCAFTALFITGAVMLNIKHVKIIANGRTIHASTFSTNPSEILKKNGIPTSPHDKIVFSGFDNNGGTIKVVPAFKVSVKADSKVSNVMMTEGTVSDALKDAGVTLGTDDIVSAPLNSDVQSGDVITVKRVTYHTKTALKSISAATVKLSTTLLKRGTVKLLSVGKAGKKAITTKIKYIDGKTAQKTVIKEKVVSKAVKSKLLVGTASGTPLSKLTAAGLKLNSGGIPERYSKCFTGPATAYWARRGALTDSGRLAGVGYVAVNPKLIPYGSKLYILAVDGSFVYGTAVAADTGTFVNDGSGVAVDLYFPSKAACCRFGERTVHIYVLK